MEIISHLWFSDSPSIPSAACSPEGPRIRLSKRIRGGYCRSSVRQWRHRRPLRDHMRLLTRDSLEIDFLACWLSHVRAHMRRTYDAIAGLARGGPRSWGCGRAGTTTSAPSQRRRDARRRVSASRDVIRTDLDHVLRSRSRILRHVRVARVMCLSIPASLPIVSHVHRVQTHVQEEVNMPFAREYWIESREQLSFIFPHTENQFFGLIFSAPKFEV